MTEQNYHEDYKGIYFKKWETKRGSFKNEGLKTCNLILIIDGLLRHMIYILGTNLTIYSYFVEHLFEYGFS